MARRLATEAKIVLERAGYDINRSKLNRGEELRVYENGNLKLCIHVTGGTVDNAEVVKLLDAKGFTETGHKKKICEECNGDREIYVAVDGWVTCPSCGYERNKAP